jgi:hypothetical protein
VILPFLAAVRVPDRSAHLSASGRPAENTEELASADKKATNSLPNKIHHFCIAQLDD